MSNHTKSEKEKIEILKEGIEDGKHVFLLVFMNGCGPCNETKPKWFKFEDDNENNDKVVIIDIEQASVEGIENLIGGSPGGFPCMRYIYNGKVEEYEDCQNLDKSNLRTIESFNEWLRLKTGNQAGGKKNRTLKKRKMTKRMRMKKYEGGKWSLKYKRSIDCKRPKGFSQRQHCKYGRKK